MKISNRVIILVTLILSVSYIFGIDYYDKKESKVKSLYQKVTLPEVTYTDVYIAFNGIKTGEKLNERDLAVKQSQSIYMLSHDHECSKLCAQLHPQDTSTEFVQEDERLSLQINRASEIARYTVSVKSQKDIGYNTYYKIEMQGIQDLNELDSLRGYAQNLFNKWKVRPKETLYFKGTIMGKIDPYQKKNHAAGLLGKLKARQTGYYEDDSSHETVAYYGYTKTIKDYILDENGEKTNVQISFSYHEAEDYTQMIIAFPFYNEPF